MKRVHKFDGWQGRVSFDWAVLTDPTTVCKMQNKTWAFEYSRRWNDVTCKRCLKARKIK